LLESGAKPVSDGQLLALQSDYIFEETSAQTNQGIKSLFERFLSAVVELATRAEKQAEGNLRDPQGCKGCGC
jgi:hypothetical protein